MSVRHDNLSVFISSRVPRHFSLPFVFILRDNPEWLIFAPNQPLGSLSLNPHFNTFILLCQRLLNAFIVQDFAVNQLAKTEECEGEEGVCSSGFVAPGEGRAAFGIVKTVKEQETV